MCMGTPAHYMHTVGRLTVGRWRSTMRKGVGFEPSGAEQGLADIARHVT
jgi:hypothetical protein